MERKRWLKEIKCITVAVIVQLPNEISRRVLMVIEGNSKAWKNKGQISVPAGVVEDGEQPIDAAKRELREEVGINIDKKDLSEQGYFVMYVRTGEGVIKVNAYVFHILFGAIPEVHIDGREITGYMFMGTKELATKPLIEIRPCTIETIQGKTENGYQRVLYTDGPIYNVPEAILRAEINAL